MSVRFVLLLLPGLVPLAGCNPFPMGHVKGRVTCNGKPVREAAITFAPIPSSEKDREPGKPATGFTDKEGNYVLSTFRNYDGALVGKHRVTVVLDDTNPARCARTKELMLEVQPRNNELNIELSK